MASNTDSFTKLTNQTLYFGDHFREGLLDDGLIQVITATDQLRHSSSFRNIVMICSDATHQILINNIDEGILIKPARS